MELIKFKFGQFNDALFKIQLAASIDWGPKESSFLFCLIRQSKPGLKYGEQVMIDALEIAAKN